MIEGVLLEKSYASITLKQLELRRGAAQVGPLDLHVRAGELVALSGPNGSGKSTLLLALAGLQPVVAGEIESVAREAGGGAASRKVVLGNAQQQRLPRDRGCALLQQELGLWPHLTLAQQCRIMRASCSHRSTVAAAEQAFEEWCELLQLKELLSRKPLTLSGGQAQRAALLRTLCGNAGWYLFDEPYSAQHEEGIRQIDAVIDRLLEQGAILFVAGNRQRSADHTLVL